MKNSLTEERHKTGSRIAHKLQKNKRKNNEVKKEREKKHIKLTMQSNIGQLY